MFKKKIPSPITRGAVKVPVVMQLEALECGAASLTMVMAYYGKWVPLEQVRSDCGVSRDGSKASNIYRAAKRYGFDAKAFRLSPESLRTKGKFPCIIHWGFNHFVVLDGFKGKYAHINDPARGFVKVGPEEFDQEFTGIVIELAPGEDFQPSGKPKSTLSFARKRLVGAGGAVAFVMLTTAIGYLFGIINSVTSRIFLDRLLMGENREWLVPFISVMVLLAIIQIAVAWAQAVYSLKINGKMAAIGSTSYMWKVLRMPMEFFSQRLAGDIQGRLVLNASVAGTLVNTFAPVLLNTVMMVFYLALMLRQSLLLSLIGVTALVINMVMARIISNKRVNITRVLMRDSGKLTATAASGIAMIETIKSSGAENGFFQKWAGYQASVNTQNIKAQRTEALLGKIPLFFTDLANYTVLVLGVFLTMQGKYTLGGVMMFQGFLTSFMAPAMTLVSAGQAIQEMRAQMERVEDVMEYPEDEALVNPEGEDAVLRKLQANLELKNVTFGYSRLEKPLIEDFSLKLEGGQRVALGFEKPEKGAIYYDRKDINSLDPSSLRRKIGTVMQDAGLFQGDIYSNIVITAPQLTLDDAWEAAEAAGIADDIRAMPMGMNTLISEGQGGISGGQRQRIMIARAIAPKPRLLIFDEATSALDNKTQKQVSEALDAMGCTRLVIAHRLSTIRRCDRILVLDGGRIIEDGTYDQLIEKGGFFAELVERQRLDTAG